MHGTSRICYVPPPVASAAPATMISTSEITSGSSYVEQQQNSSNNNNLMLQILRDRDLAAAGTLFLVRNEQLGDLHEALLEIESILRKSSNYLFNKNDQSSVEICIARITTAIRGTRQTEFYAVELTKVLNACVVQAACDDTSPYAKVASDLCNCLFATCYDKRRVMEMAIPVGIKLLIGTNAGSAAATTVSTTLAKNMISYVTLAAESNADVIANYASQLVEATIRNHNLALLRVLPQIYAYNPNAINAHLPSIVRTITKCSQTEKNCLITLLQLSFEFINERLAYETASTLLHQLSAATPALVNDIFPLLRRFCFAYPNIVTQLLGDTYRLPDIAVYRAAQDLLLQNSGGSNANASKQPSAATNYYNNDESFNHHLYNNNNNDFQQQQHNSHYYAGNAKHATSRLPYEYGELLVPPPSITNMYYPYHYQQQQQQLQQQQQYQSLYAADEMYDAGAAAAATQHQQALLIPPAWKSSSAAQSRLSLGTGGGGGGGGMVMNNSNNLMQTTMVMPSMMSSNKAASMRLQQRRNSRSTNGNTADTAASNSLLQRPLPTDLSRERLFMRSIAVEQSAAVAAAAATSWLPHSSTYAAFNNNNFVQPTTFDIGGAAGNFRNNSRDQSLYLPTGGATTMVSHSASSLTNHRSSSAGRRTRRRDSNTGDALNDGGRNVIKSCSLSRLTKTLSNNIVSRRRASHQHQQAGTIADLDNPDAANNTLSTGGEQLLRMMPRNRLALSAARRASATNVAAIDANKFTSNNSATAGTPAASASAPTPEEISHVINPILSQDAMQQFCERNMPKIKSYVNSILVKYPLPYKCAVVVEQQQDDSSVNNFMQNLSLNNNNNNKATATTLSMLKSNRRSSKIGRKACKLYFQCQKRGPACLYPAASTPSAAAQQPATANAGSFVLQTNIADIWLHLMFLALQAKSQRGALGQQDTSVHSLKMTFEHLELSSSANQQQQSDHGGNRSRPAATASSSFAQLATSAFPTARRLEMLLLSELRQARYFNAFQYNALDKRWCCFLCNNAELVKQVIQDGSSTLSTTTTPVICEGLLKEFHCSRLLGVQRWKSRYFSLRGRALVRQRMVNNDNDDVAAEYADDVDRKSTTRSRHVSTAAGMLSSLLGRQQPQQRNGDRIRRKALKIQQNTTSSSSASEEFDIGLISSIQIVSRARDTAIVNGSTRSRTYQHKPLRQTDAENHQECDEDDDKSRRRQRRRQRDAELAEYEADERRETKNQSRCFFTSSKDEDDGNDYGKDAVAVAGDDDDDDYHHNNSNDFSNHSTTTATTDRDNRRLLEIVTVNGQVLLLQAPSRATAEKWLSSVTTALIRHRLAINGSSSNNTSLNGQSSSTAAAAGAAGVNQQARKKSP